MAAMVAVIPSATSVLTFTQGIFMEPILRAYGWSQAAYLAPMSIALICAALLQPPIGLAIDRYGIRPVIIPLLFLFGLAATSLAFVTEQYGLFFFLSFIAGVASVAQSPLFYGRMVAGWATSHRGFALSIALSGLAIGNLILPALASLLLHEFGWRAARAALGLSIFAVALPMVWFLLPEPPRAADAAATGKASRSDLIEILRSRQFWQVALALSLTNMALGGHIAVLVPMLKDNGMAIEAASGMIVAVALAQVGGRLLSGKLLDIVPNAAVGAIWLLCGAAGIAVLNVAHTIPMGILGGALVGAGLGAELELAAYYTTRFFPMHVFGRVYGLFLVMFIMGYALGSFALGLSHDLSGSYAAASLPLCGALLVAAMLILTLGRYLYGADEEAASGLFADDRAGIEA